MFTRAARSLPRLCALAVCLLVVAVCASPAFSATGSAAGTPTLFAVFPWFASGGCAGSFGTTPWSDLGVRCLSSHTVTTADAIDLTGSNFARPTFARTINWNVTKSVDQAGQNVPDGGSATFNYTVTVTHDDGAGTDSGWQVTGQITVFNQNDAAVDDVAVSDAIDDPNAKCVVSHGSSTIPGEGHITFDYACMYSAAPDAVNETSTALISWPAQTLTNFDSLPAGSVTAETAVAWDNPFVLNGSVDVGDSLVGALGSLSYTDPSPTTFTYPYTFDDNPVDTCTSHDNTADVENDAAVVSSDSVKVQVCSGSSDLTVANTATPSFTRTFGWAVTKSVDTTSQNIAAGGAATFNYAVDASKDAGVDSDWTVTGTIAVDNPNGWDVNANLADTAPGATCALDQTSVTVPANGSVAVGYTCTSATGAPGTNTATATWDSTAYATPTGSASSSSDYAFATPTDLVNDTVGVYDNGSLLGTTDHTRQFSYPKSFAGTAGTCTSYDNTATAKSRAEVIASSKTVTVTVCVNNDLTVSTAATPSFTRTYMWTIAKSVAGPTTVTPAGGTATFNYTVNANGAGTTDSGQVVAGKVTVTNPNDWDAITANVTDAVDNGGACTVVNGTAVSIPADSSVTVDYSCTYASSPSPAGGVNTAVASWDTSASPTPHPSAIGTVGFTFGAPTTEINKTVTVGDTFNGSTTTLGTVAYPGPGTFAYSRTVNAPVANCLTYPNTAAIAETGQSASASVTVCASAQTCTGQKINVRWHYSANGSSGSWSGTKSTACDGSVLTIGPQAMEGDLKLAPGTTLTAGYDFTIPGNTTTLTVTFNNPRVVFALRCVSGATPSQSTLTVPMSTSTTTVKDSAWYPSGDQHSPLVYQGSVTVPNVCGGGQVRLDKGGTFTTSVGGSGAAGG